MQYANVIWILIQTNLKIRYTVVKIFVGGLYNLDIWVLTERDILDREAFYFSDNTVIHVDETVISFKKRLRQD